MRMILAIAFFSSIQALEYQVQFENENVSVVKVVVSPHEKTPLHRDEFPHLVVALKGGVMTRLEADGRTVEVEFPTGVPVYRPIDPVGELHRSVNHSDEFVELIIVYLKGESQ